MVLPLILDVRRRPCGFALPFLLILTLIYSGWTTPAYAKWIGIGPYGGSISSLAIHPVNTRTIYAGTDGGGIFKSTDGGGK
jgi:hypothetical protein